MRTARGRVCRELVPHTSCPPLVARGAAAAAAAAAAAVANGATAAIAAFATPPLAFQRI